MAVLTGIITKAGISVAKYSWEKLKKEEPASKAIGLTSKHFLEKSIEVAPALTKWCESDEFKNIVSRIASSDTSVSDSEIAWSFIKTGDLYLEAEPAEQEKIAADVIAYFAEEYRKIEFAGPQASLHLSNQIKNNEKNRNEDQVAMMAAIQSMQQSMQDRAVLADETRAGEIAGEKIIDSTIEQIGKLIKKRRFLLAQELLLNLDADFTPDRKTTTQKFRIANNLGVCALHLNNLPAARKKFADALVIDPDNEKALGNAAMAAFIDNEPEVALDLSQKSRATSTTDYSPATTVHIQSLQALGRTQDIDTLIEQEEWIQHDPACLLALGAVSYLNRDYKKAEGYLRTSVEKDDSDPQAFELLAISIFHPILYQMQDDPALPWRITDDTINRVKEAESYASRAVALLEEGDDSFRLLTALSYRAQMRAVYGDLDGALKDSERVLIYNESYDLALNAKGIILLKKGQSKDALTYLELVSDAYIRESAVVHLASAYINDKNVPKAIELLEDSWDPNSNEKRMIHITDGLILAYSHLPVLPAQKTENIREFLDTKWKDDPEALIAKSNLFHVEKKYADAKQTLLSALKTAATDNQKDYIHLALAEQSFELEDWGEATKYYSLIINSKAPLNFKQHYAISLLNAGQMPEALEYTQFERGSGVPLPIISDIEARVLEHMNDLPNALELRLKINETIDDPNQENLIKGFMLALRQGKDADARDIILRVDLEKIQNNPWALSQVAQAYTIAGIEGAIPLAYKARLMGFEHAEYHLAYLRIFLSREDPEAEAFRPAEVKNDSVVELALSNGKTQTYIITDGEPADKQKRIISLTDSVALKLLGKTAGESVILKEGGIETLVAEIKEVKSKYVYAFQESLLNFSAWFPDNQSIGVMDVSGEDFSPLFSQLDKRYAHVSYVMQLHKEKRIPLSLTARLLSRSRITVWIGMISDNEGHIFASRPGPEDIEGDIASRKVVLDLIAILSADYLNILDKLNEAFGEIYVPQSVLDEINRELIDEKTGSPNKGSIGRGRNGYFSYEASEGNVQNYIDFLTKLKEFIIDQTTVVPVSTALSIDKKKFLELSKLLGDSALDSILVAQEKEALLFADDLAISDIAKTDWAVSSVWSQTVIAYLKKLEIISEADYREKLYKLVVGNYQFPTYNVDDFLWAIEKNNWQATNELERFMNLLEGPYCDEDWAVETCAELIKQTVLNLLQEQSRILFIDFLIKTLLKGRNPRVVLEKLRLATIKRFNLLQVQLADVLETIKLWKLRL